MERDSFRQPRYERDRPAIAAALTGIICIVAAAVPGGCKDRSLSQQRPNASLSGKSVAQPAAHENDSDKLGRYINFPAPPRGVKWQSDQAPGGNDWALTALLEFSPEVIAQLLKTSPALGGTTRVSAEHLRAWFPVAIAQASPATSTGADAGQVSGKDGEQTASKDQAVPVNARRIEAVAFIAPHKSPLIHGDALVFPSANLVYLRLFTM